MPQVMKLAVRYKRKALTFISSVGVAGPLGLSETVQETTLGTNIATGVPRQRRLRLWVSCRHDLHPAGQCAGHVIQVYSGYA